MLDRATVALALEFIATGLVIAGAMLLAHAGGGWFQVWSPRWSSA